MTDIAKLIQKYSPVETDEIKISGTMDERITVLARELAEKSTKLQHLKNEVKELNKRISSLAYNELPTLMLEAEIASYTTSTGATLTLTPFYKASLPQSMDQDKKEYALQYLREKAPEIIGTEIAFRFDATERMEAEAISTMLKELGLDPEIVESVHWATLTAWVKERFLAGEEIPFKRLNAKVGTYVAVSIDEDAARAFGLLRKIDPNRMLDGDDDD